MKNLLAALALLLAISPAFGQGTPKSKANLNLEVTNNFPDNTTGLITPLLLRTTTNDIIASMQQAPAVNAQVGTTYTVALSDFGQLITQSNGSASTITIPQGTGSFANFNFAFQNKGTGTATLSPTTSTVCGSASQAVLTNQSLWIFSDGTNYQCFGPYATGTGSGTVQSVGLIGPGGVFSVIGSPVTNTGNITLGVSGTQGGIPWFFSTTQINSTAALTNNGIVYGGGTNTPASTNAGSAGMLLLAGTATSNPPTMASMSQDCTISTAGVITCTKTNNVAFGQLATQSVPCTLAQGCTGGTSAALARTFNAGNSLNIDACTVTGSSAYVVQPTDRCVTHSALGGNVTDTLPAASAVNPGQTLWFTDFAGVAVNGAKQVSVQRAGADTINGGTTANAVTGQYGTAIFVSDGNSKWTQFVILGAGTGTVQSVATSGCATGGTFTTTGTVAVTPATNSQIYTAGVNNCIDAAGALSSSALFGLTDAATITVDMSLFKNASVTLAGNRTLGNPTNTNDMIGQCGHIYFTQDGTGTRTLGYASSWRFTGAAAPTLTTAAGSVDMLNFCVRDATHIDATLIKDLR